MRSTFSHIVDVLNAANKAREDDDAPSDVGTDDADDEDQEPKRKTKKKAAPEIEEQDDEGDEPKGDYEDSDERKPKGGTLTPAQVVETAAAIVRAGAQRRGELEIPITAPPQPRQMPLTPTEVRSTAAAILAAGKKARSPT